MADQTTDFSFGRFGHNRSVNGSTIGANDGSTEYHTIEFLADSTVIEIVDFFGNNWWNGRAFEKNDKLYGRFKSIKVTGDVMCYKAFQF